MNWKNVLSLMRIERKSGRLLRGRKTTYYHENRFLAYWPYWVALAVGLAAGILAGVGSNFALMADPKISSSFYQGALNIFASLPTLVMIYSLVFTLFQQIQRSGVRASSQVPYWLPVTWQEHTLASILASLLGFPLASVVCIASALIPFSFFVGLVLPAVLAVLAVCAAAFMASATTEVLRILQVRFIGAVYKSTGRAAVWVRFIGSLMFFMVFYAVYFYVTSGSGSITFIQTISSTQSAVWFVPFVWLGLTLYAFTVSGLLLQGSIFLILSILFIAGLFFFATLLNRRFGLYEPPAITVSRGTYTPRTGLLGKFGFSIAEAALIRKDMKAFTRRRELMTVFIVPIAIILVPLMQSLSRTNQAMPPQFSIYMTALTFLLPASVLAMISGNFMIGEEGQAIWRIYSAPISARNLVKSKYFFIVFFSLVILVITGIFGFFVFHPSVRTVIVASIEAVFLVFALGAISFSNGISGADFTEVPRSRMVRTATAWLNIIACLLAGMAILAPFFPYILSDFIPSLFGFYVDFYQAVIVSAIIAFVLTIIFYRIALKNAKELLAKAEI
jgi:hypothetical protein